ncbi:hypothetical protein L2E82_35211 [Cichorium intybus]|uniref:Uncharacterized protein n=1 Tax=Cichorium intybus TaxID=13427 RepID=A0ACB9BNH1_CICIN|nr:hypothetical protein L2E82_35211 [Cichorium intybus]
MASQSRSDTDTVTVANTNLHLSEDLKAYKPHLRALIHILSRHTLARAFFHPPPSIPLSVLQEIVFSATKCPSGYAITLPNNHRVVIDKKLFVEALHLPYHTSTLDQPFDGDLMAMIYKMGYLKMGGTNQLNRRLLGLLWSLYSGREVDYARILFDDFLNYIPSSLKPSGEAKLIMQKAKPYTAKTDSIFGEIRRLPEALLKLADPANSDIVSHITSTGGIEEYPPRSLKECEALKKPKKKASESSPSKQPLKKKQRKIITMPEPSSKDSESEHLEERQNSPGSEDTQDDPFMEENHNQPPPPPPKKNSPTPTQNPRVDFFPTFSQPPSDASEFDKWKFKHAVHERNEMVARLKQQFEYKQKELQTLLNFGSPSDSDPAHIKSERTRINALILQVDSFLHSSLEKLVDSSFYLFDTTDTTGISIGITNHHSLCDATTRHDFLKAWSLIAMHGTDELFLASGSLPFYERVVKYPSSLDEMALKKARISAINADYQPRQLHTVSRKQCFLMASELFGKALSEIVKKKNGLIEEGETLIKSVFVPVPGIGVAGSTKIKIYDLDFG